MRVHKIRILSSEKAWLSDEIIQCAQEMLIEVGKTNGLFSVDNPVQPKIVVISPAQVLHHAVLRFLVVPDEAEEKRPGWKNTLRKMNGDQAAVIEGSTLQEGYKYSSKELCPYQNIFQFLDAWFLSIINYPTTAELWMLTPCQKQNILYLWPSGGQRTKSKRQTSLSKLYWLRS